MGPLSSHPAASRRQQASSCPPPRVPSPALRSGFVTALSTGSARPAPGAAIGSGRSGGSQRCRRRERHGRAGRGRRARRGGRLAGRARISQRLHSKNGRIVFPKQYSADGRTESVSQPSPSPPAVPGSLLPSFGSRSELPAGNQFARATGARGEHRRSLLPLKSRRAFGKEVCQGMPRQDVPGSQVPATATWLGRGEVPLGTRAMPLPLGHAATTPPAARLCPPGTTACPSPRVTMASAARLLPDAPRTGCRRRRHARGLASGRWLSLRQRRHVASAPKPGLRKAVGASVPPGSGCRPRGSGSHPTSLPADRHRGGYRECRGDCHAPERSQRFAGALLAVTPAPLPPGASQIHPHGRARSRG